MAPAISIILIAYRMSEQLQRTLLTLAPEYQRGVSADEYEVVLVENSSTDNLPAATVAQLPDNFRYFLREEPGHSPVPAINIAFSECRGTFIGLVMDGARMLSPGCIRTALDAFAITTDALVAVPGYHLGEQEQHLHETDAEALVEEQALLNSIDWRGDGYELFSIATFSGANRRGYLHPIMECNCVFASAANFRRIGYADPQFTMPGGGSINLHIYRSLGMLPGTRVFVLPGEGSFHQYHGGVTTSSYADRQAEIERHRVQLHSLWPGGFHSLRRKPTLLGEISMQAFPFLEDSLRRSRNRLKRRSTENLPAWPDDPDHTSKVRA
jgi:glycosyltransferase involved in cell wall biosynthesis